MIGEACVGEDEVGEQALNETDAGYVKGEVEAAAEIVVESVDENIEYRSGGRASGGARRQEWLSLAAKADWKRNF